MKIVIVGYGPGGVAAATAARAFDSSAEISIITEETIDAHRKPGASMALEFPDTDRLAISDWSFATLKGRRIEVISGTTVLEGDSTAKTLIVRDKKGKESMLNYDQLIIATGGSPAVPSLTGNDLSGVYTIQTMVDASVLGNALGDLQSIAVIGAGFSGLETAERLSKLGKEVHLIVRSRLMRKQLETSMSEELQTRISKRVRLHVGAAPEAITGDKKANGIMLNGEKLDVDAVLFMTGVKPNIRLAESLNLETGSLGGIKVDNQMMTSLDGIFAVGDCVEMIDSLSNKPVLMPVGSTAARAGRQAGVAAVGGKKIYTDTSLLLQYDRIFDTDVICIGHSTTMATDLGIKTKAHFLEDSTEFAKVALITDSNGILIGGQVLAARMGARIGYQIYERIVSKAVLDERPLLKPTHDRMKELLQASLGPIR